MLCRSLTHDSIGKERREMKEEENNISVKKQPTRSDVRKEKLPDSYPKDPPLSQ